MRLASKDEQILHIYFVTQKDLCFYFIYIVFILKI